MSRVSLVHDARFQLVAALVGAALIGGLLWWGYRTYRGSVNEAAQLAFVAQYEQFEVVKQKVTQRPDLWAASAEGFYKEGQKQSSSDLAPFFTAFSAQAFSALGDHAAVKERMQELMRQLKPSNPLYYLYKTKAAVLGFESLDALAQDVKNPYRALAYYYTWYHAWIAGKEAEATAAYTKLQGLPDGTRLASYAAAQMEFTA